jgi:hypothetical protein
VEIANVHGRRGNYMLFYTYIEDEQIPHHVWHRLNEAQRTMALCIIF